MSIIIFPYLHAIIVLYSYAPSLPSLAIHLFKKIYLGEHRLQWDHGTSGARCKHSSRDRTAGQSQKKEEEC